MLRLCEEQDKEKVNNLLKNTQYEIEEINPYRHYIVLDDKEVKGILIYDEIYDRFELIYIYAEKESRKKGY